VFDVTIRSSCRSDGLVSSHRHNVVFLCNTYVEVDNFLPLIYFLRRNLPELSQRICILKPDKSDLETSLLSTLLDSIELITTSHLLSPKLRVIVKLLEAITIRIKNVAETNKHNSTYSLHRFLVRTTLYLRKIFILLGRADIRRIGQFDVVVAAPGIYDAIINPAKFGSVRRVETHLLRNIFEMPKLLKVMLPETYDQFLPGFSQTIVVDSNIMKKMDWVLLNSDKETESNPNYHTHVDVDKSLVIGCPRYSESWCLEINDLVCKDNQRMIEDTGVINVLYLPMRTTDTFPKYSSEENTRLETIVIELVHRHKQIKLLVKPHPKVTTPFRFWSNVPESLHDRIEIFGSHTDTAQLMCRTDLIITPGTSVIAHYLWENKPVILFGNWLREQGYRYVYEPWCFTEKDIPVVLNQLKSGITNVAANPNTKSEMIDFFQLGLASENYQEMLVSNFRKIFQSHHNSMSRI